MYLQVVFNIPINQSFTYSYTQTDSEKEEKAEIGKRVAVTFGNKKTTGIIISLNDKFPEECGVEEGKIKPVRKIIDKEPLFTKELLELAGWISRYYLCSLGEAVFSMIPSARRETGAGGFSFENELFTSSKINLSDEQKKAVSEIIKSDNGNNFHYIYGPTGSGKTEVFLKLAEKVLNEGKGVIYLVPEIGLTGQVTKSVVEKFGSTAAIIHSGLTPSQRLQQWNKILHKEARVIVGARSAVFAPVPDLGLIIIDEEHDGSYKSGNAPRYHARQVAMHRCQKLNIPLVMGSATPSVECWYGMQNNTIIRHSLTKRLSGGQFPQIKCINLNEFTMEGCISKPLEEEINKTLEQKHQTILFLNRRGFSHFFKCNTCGFELVCKNCSIPLTYHKVYNRLKCHYCGWQIEPPQSCPKCGSLDIGSSGFGTEFIESETKAKFPNARILRLDTDSVSKKEELLEKLDEFRNNKYDILLGTQMVAKGLNFPNLQLVGVILADAGLHLPDFRAGERTFSLITQVAGRSGRYFPDGKVLVQTYNPQIEAVRFAVSNQISEFYEYELQNRNILEFPPFSRLVRLVFRSYDKRLAYEFSKDAYSILKNNLPKGAQIIGPAECPLEKINSNYRYHILLKGKSIIPLQAAARSLLYNYSHSPNVYIEYDVDPVSIL